MTFSRMIEVGIGLMLLYFLLALLCTTLNELIQNLLGWRAKSLSQALSQLIDNERLHDAFRSHGLIQSLEATARPNRDVKDGKPQMSYLDSRSFASALVDSLDKLKGVRSTIPEFGDIEKAVRELPDSRIRDVLLASLTDANADLAKVKASVAKWFDNAMDRLSGYHKRWAQGLSLGIGLVLAVVLNADTLDIANKLWRDGDLRNEIVNLAVQTVQKGRDTSPCSQEAKNATAPLTSEQLSKEAQCLTKQATDIVAAASAFPIGWVGDEWTKSGESGWWGRVWWLALKVSGLLWTAAALALGATFWFDMLQKVIGVRSTGPKPGPSGGAKEKAP